MKIRAVKFILALSALAVLDWAAVEFLVIGEFINNRTVSIVWAVACLVLSCAYGVWRCPWEENAYEDNAKHKEDESCP